MTRMIQKITTPRLIVRRVAFDDWKAIQSVWSDRAVSSFAQYDKPVDLADSAVCVRIAKWASFSDSLEHMFFAVCLEARVIGYISFNQRSEGYEIGYCFHSAYHGNGYALESVSHALNELKALGVPRVTAGTALDNRPSVRLLQKLGFQLIGTESVSFYNDSNGDPVYFQGGIFELRLL